MMNIKSRMSSGRGTPPRSLLGHSTGQCPTWIHSSRASWSANPGARDYSRRTSVTRVAFRPNQQTDARMEPQGIYTASRPRPSALDPFYQAWLRRAL